MEAQAMMFYETEYNSHNTDIVRTVIVDYKDESRWGLCNHKRSVFSDIVWWIHDSSEDIEIWVRKASHEAFLVGVSAGPETDIVCRRFDIVVGNKYLPKIGRVVAPIYEFDLYREIDETDFSRSVDEMNMEIIKKENSFMLRVGFETQADYLEWKLKQ